MAVVPLAERPHRRTMNELDQKSPSVPIREAFDCDAWIATDCEAQAIWTEIG